MGRLAQPIALARLAADRQQPDAGVRRSPGSGRRPSRPARTAAGRPAWDRSPHRRRREPPDRRGPARRPRGPAGTCPDCRPSPSTAAATAAPVWPTDTHASAIPLDTSPTATATVTSSWARSVESGLPAIDAPRPASTIRTASGSTPRSRSREPRHIRRSDHDQVDGVAGSSHRTPGRDGIGHHLRRSVAAQQVEGDSGQGLDVQDATLGVGAAGRARGVREALLLAADAGDQGRHRGLPLRAAVTGVGAGHLPLRNWHGTSFARLLAGRTGDAWVVSPRSYSASGSARAVSAAQRGSVVSCTCCGSSSSRTPHAGHSPRQSSRTAGRAAGRAPLRPAASAPGRSGRPGAPAADHRTHPPPRRSRLGVGRRVSEQLGDARSPGASRTCPGTASTPRLTWRSAEPDTRTPSRTDSNRRSSSIGEPSGTRAIATPRPVGAGTSRVTVTIDPGER